MNTGPSNCVIALTRVFRKHFNFGKTKLADISAADINRKLDKLVETPSEHLHALNTAKIFFNLVLSLETGGITTLVRFSPCQ